MRQPRVTPSAATFACLAVALAGALPARAQVAVGQDFGERIEVNTVNVEVHVTDKSGRPVSGLERGDFTLFEDGKRMEIVNFDAAIHPAAAPSTAAPAGSGAPVPQLAAARDPASWVFYVDNSFIRPASRARVLRQLREFASRDLVAGDQVMVVSYDHGLHIRLPFTGDRAALGRALEGLEGLMAGGSELERARRETLHRMLDELGGSEGMVAGFKPTREAKHERPGEESSDGGGARAGSPPQCPASISLPVKDYADAVRHEVLGSISALTVLVNSLSGVSGRKVLLHVSDGIPLTPGEDLFQVLFQICGGGGGISGLQSSSLPVYDSSGGLSTGYKGTQAALDAQAYTTANQWTAFAAHANAQRVTLYTLQASGAESLGAGGDMGPDDRVLALPEVATIESQNRQGPLSVMASETGGRAIFWANDIRPELAHIQEDLTSFYSLGFNPPHTGDGREHRIEIRLKRSGVTVRYGQSYRDKPPLERAVDHALASLFYGYQDNPLDIRLEIGETAPADAKTWTVPVRLRIPLFKLGLQARNDLFEGKLRLLVVLRDAQGGTTPVRQVEVPIRIPHDKAITALGQFYLYELKLSLKGGEQQLAIAVRDEVTTTTSYLARTLTVGGTISTR